MTRHLGPAVSPRARRASGLRDGCEMSSRKRERERTRPGLAATRRHTSCSVRLGWRLTCHVCLHVHLHFWSHAEALTWIRSDSLDGAVALTRSLVPGIVDLESSHHQIYIRSYIKCIRAFEFIWPTADCFKKNFFLNLFPRTMALCC